MLNKIAQVNLAPTDGFRGFGPLGLFNRDADTAPDVFTNVLSTIIGVMTVIAFIWFVIQFFLGAVGIVFSGGDKGKVTESRTKMTNSLIGLVVVIAAVALIQLVGTVLGIDILNIATYIRRL